MDEIEEYASSLKPTYSTQSEHGSDAAVPDWRGEAGAEGYEVAISFDRITKSSWSELSELLFSPRLRHRGYVGIINLRLKWEHIIMTGQLTRGAWMELFEEYEGLVYSADLDWSEEEEEELQCRLRMQF